MIYFCEEQAGFRKDYSTIDHIYSLKLIIDCHIVKRKKVFWAFIGYRTTFDSANHIALWSKLLSNGVDGKCSKIL